MRYVAGNLAFSDYRLMTRTLRQIDPELVKSLRKRYREIGKEPIKGIKSKIPNNAPLSHMVSKVGRLSWSRTQNQKMAIKSAVVKERRRAPSKGMLVVGLIVIRVGAAPTSMADMAGRSGKSVNARPFAKANGSDAAEVESGKYKGQMGYQYTNRKGKVVGRIHRINGQGAQMIKHLNGRGKASRFVYPGAEAALPEAKVQMRIAIDAAAAEVNKRLRIDNGN